MSDKIVAIRTGTPIPKTPNAEVIALLRKYLAQAERGEIDAVAIAASRPNDKIACAYEFGLASFRLCSAVMWLHTQIFNCMNDVSKETVDRGDDGA